MNSQGLLNKVKADYQTIASDFSKTRQNLSWPEIDYFKKYIKNGQSVLDLGCGNGRLLNSLKEFNCEYKGLDNSVNLIDHAKKIFPDMSNNFVVGELFELPFADQQFDVIFCLAAFHHLPTKELRLQALNEMRRVLKKDGIVLMTNWCVWQKLFWKNIFTEFRLKNKWNDFFIPWKSTNERINRYYYGFTQHELGSLFAQTNWEIIENDFFPKNSWPKRNWLSILKKK